VSHRRDVRWSWLTVIVVIHFLDAFDGLAASVALPSIERAFGLSTTDSQWVLNAGFLAFGGLLLLGGRLGDRWGRRRLFVVGLVLFGTGAVLAVLSPFAGLLFVSRALQGVGGAAALPAAIGLLVAEHEGPARSRAFGVWTVAAGAAFSTGSVVGGLLTETLTWRAVFVAEVPLAFGAALVGHRVLPLSVDDSAPERLDVRGATAGTVALGTVLVGITLLNGDGVPAAAGWTTIALGAALATYFLSHERRAAEPLVPRMLFSSRARRGAYLVTLFHPAGVTGAVFVTSLYLQRALGYGAVEAGLGLLAFAVPLTVLSPFIDRVVERFNPRNGTVVGLALSAAGMVMLGLQARPQAQYLDDVLPGLVIAGVGVALAFVGLNVAAALEIQRDAAAINGSVFKAADQVGGAVAVAVLAAVIAAVSAGRPVAGYRAVFLTTTVILAAGAALAQREIRRW
jgi:MFS family permease